MGRILLHMSLENTGSTNSGTTSSREAAAPPPTPETRAPEAPLFSENEVLPSLYWGQKIARETERSIGNLGLRMDTERLAAASAKEAAHLYEKRTNRLKNKAENLEMTRDRRDDEIETLKDPNSLMNRFAVTAWINTSRIKVKQYQNQLTNWRLRSTKESELTWNSKWQDAQNTFQAADRRRLEFAERIDQRIEARLSPVRERLGNIDSRIKTIQSAIAEAEKLANKFQTRIERLQSLKSLAPSQEEKNSIDALIKDDRNALFAANARMQRDLYPRLAKANKHHERVTRAFVFAAAGQEKIAARYNLSLSGVPANQAYERSYQLPSSTDTTHGALPSLGSSPAYSLDLRRLLSELFPPFKPTVKDMLDAWNRRFGYTGAIIKNPDEFWEIVSTNNNGIQTYAAQMDSEAKGTADGTAEEWQQMLEHAVDSNEHFREMVYSLKSNSETPESFISAFINSLR